MPSITREDARPKPVQPWYEKWPVLAGMLAGAAWVALLWLGAEMRP